MLVTVKKTTIEGVVFHLEGNDTMQTAQDGKNHKVDMYIPVGYMKAIWSTVGKKLGVNINSNTKLYGLDIWIPDKFMENPYEHQEQ